MKDIMKQRISESIEVKRGLLENEDLLNTLEVLTEEVITAIKNGHKLVLCGNGGSASDALQFVLNADVATMTAIGNDYGYDDVFARQAQGHCQLGDVFIGISTSGNSENVLRAVCMAKSKGCKTGALLGDDGGKIGKTVDYPLIVPCNITARVQESHILLIHIICELVEKVLCDE